MLNLLSVLITMLPEVHCIVPCLIWEHLSFKIKKFRSKDPSSSTVTSKPNTNCCSKIVWGACTAWPSSGLSQCVAAVQAYTMQSNGSGISVWLICGYTQTCKPPYLAAAASDILFSKQHVILTSLKPQQLNSYRVK